MDRPPAARYRQRPYCTGYGTTNSDSYTPISASTVRTHAYTQLQTRTRAHAHNNTDGQRTRPQRRWRLLGLLGLDLAESGQLVLALLVDVVEVDSRHQVVLWWRRHSAVRTESAEKRLASGDRTATYQLSDHSWLYYQTACCCTECVDCTYSWIYDSVAAAELHMIR